MKNGSKQNDFNIPTLQFVQFKRDNITTIADASFMFTIVGNLHQLVIQNTSTHDLYKVVHDDVSLYSPDKRIELLPAGEDAPLYLKQVKSQVMGSVLVRRSVANLICNGMLIRLAIVQRGKYVSRITVTSWTLTGDADPLTQVVLDVKPDGTYTASQGYGSFIATRTNGD